jgi:predicted ATPase
MRIDRLHLVAFKNLVDFVIDFNEKSSRQVVVGRNGVGKSNLLEAIVQIFRDLDLEEPSTFAYQIDYVCRNTRIRIANKISSESGGSIRYKRSYETTVFGTTDIDAPFSPISEGDFYRQNRSSTKKGRRLLPSYVFGYYSGDLSRFEQIFQKHEERYYQAQIKGQESALRSLFLARPHHSQFALLSFFATADERGRQFLKDEMRIDGFGSVLFALRQPYWSKSRRSQTAVGGDSRFWGAGGKVKPFLDRLFDQSFLPMAFSERLKSGLARMESVERRYCFLPNEESLASLGQGLSNKEFFARLESLVYSNLVAEDGTDVRIWLKLRGVSSPAKFNDLAEGERQLLTVLGLLRFTAEEEALFVLDEPDTHLNPAWCLDYLKNLQMYGADLASSQIIMTTHSPMTFAGLEKNDVVIIKRVDDVVRAEHPLSAPKGMGFGAILTSEIFGLRSTLDAETLVKVDRLRYLAAADRSDEEEKELQGLNRELSGLGFSKDFRDPMYREFVEGVGALESNDDNASWPLVLSDEERLRRASLVESAVKQLRERKLEE